ncbi:MAG: efflux RND transporter permease subunit [Planctomycetes bacterium]|nr:efflux RND transporter permease subunit [Planctomycetota bacterium]
MVDLFLRRPRLLILALLLICAAGYTALQSMPRAEDPELTSRDAIIITPFLGAGAERIEALVTDPIEDALREFEEILTFDSESTADISSLHIELKEHLTETAGVWSRIRDKLEDVEETLPQGAGPIDFDAFEISAFTTIVALVPDGDPGASLPMLSRRAEDLADKLRAIGGTKEVVIYGGMQEQIVVDLEPELLAARSMTLQEVASALQGRDAKTPAGSVHGRRNDLLVDVNSELDSVQAVLRTPVRIGANGQNTLISDLGTVRKGERTPASDIALVEGERSVLLAARMMTGQRVDLWSAKAQVILGAFEADLPRGMGMRLLFNQSKYTSKRLGALVGNFLMGALLVMVVVFATMGWRSAILVGFALPLSVLMALKGMSLMEIPMNQMSVAGLIIALGLLIDNAIVMVDEISHRLQEGLSKGDAVRSAVSKLAMPLFGSTLTTALAFMPIVLMPGGAGEFVGSMAMNVILAITSSLLISLWLLPAIAVHFLPSSPRSGGWSFLKHGISLGPVAGVYRKVITFLVEHPALAVVFGLVFPLLGFSQAGNLKEQFFPPADRDQFGLELFLPRQASIGASYELAQEARLIMLEHERVDEVSWMLGKNFPKFYYNQIENVANAPYYSQALIQLDGSHDSSSVVRDLQELLDETLPGAQAIVRQVEQGPPFDAPVEMRLLGPGLPVLREMGQTIRRELAAIPDVLHTRTTLLSGLPGLRLNLNQEELRLAGLQEKDLAHVLAGNLAGLPGGSILEATEELPVVVRLARDKRDSAEDLSSLQLPSAKGGWTPLASLGDVQLAPELSNIPHLNGERVSTVQAYITAGVLPSAVLDKLLARLDEIGFEPPHGYRMVVAGEAAERDEAVGGLMGTIGILVILMGSALVLAFHSFRLAAVIGTVAIMSVGLALGSIYLSGFPFGFMGIVGTMGLIGVAINDSIVILAALEEDPACLRGDKKAIVHVLMRGTRHVLSTTLTTIAGFLPLYLGGGGFWPPVAVAIGGGVAGATLMALTTTPGLFLLLYAKKPRESDPMPVR